MIMTGHISFEELKSETMAGTIDTVLACIVDMQGRLAGKRFHAEHFVESAWEETHCCDYLLATDLEMATPDGYEATSWESGYGDYIMRPDLSTLRRVPWLDGTALVLCDVLDHHTHEEVPHSPRALLKRQLARAAAMGFEVKTATDRAAKYGNDAVLENHSITITYEEILTRDGCDIFGGMKAEGREEEWKVLLDMAKEYVLWTDPARHGELLKTLATKREEASAPTSMWNRDDPDSRSLLCRMIIHAADISNPVHSNFAVVRDWCSRISTEFAEQAKKESEAGLPVTPFMDGLDDEYRVSKQQIGFYQWMAIPFFTMVAKCLPDAAEVERHCSRNKKRYEDIVARIDDVRKNGEVLEDDEEKNEDSKEG